MAETHPNLLATGPETLLPQDPALAELTERGVGDFLSVLRAHPESSLCWALLAEASLLAGTEEDDVAGYAYARTGYHRGLDALRRSGWRGQGPVPWRHVPNQGFLRCLWALAVAAGRIGEHDEQQRCAQFLRDSSEQAHQVLSRSDFSSRAATGSPTDDAVTTGPVTTGPVTTKPATEPSATEPSTADPVTADPVTTDGVTTEPATTGPATQQGPRPGAGAGA